MLGVARSESADARGGLQTACRLREAPRTSMPVEESTGFRVGGVDGELRHHIGYVQDEETRRCYSSSQ